MTTVIPAPAQETLAIKCGADWSWSVALIDPTTGNPIALSSARMDIREDAYATARLIVSPACGVAGNVATAVLSSAASKAIQTQTAKFDFFAVRTDTNQEVALAEGSVVFTGAVTAL